MTDVDLDQASQLIDARRARTDERSRRGRQDEDTLIAYIVDLLPFLAEERDATAVPAQRQTGTRGIAHMRRRVADLARLPRRSRPDRLNVEDAVNVGASIDHGRIRATRTQESSAAR